MSTGILFYMRTNNKQFSLLMTNDIFESLRTKAFNERTTMSNLIRQAIKQIL